MTESFAGRLRIASWDESPYREVDDGSKFTNASVELSAEDGHQGDGLYAAHFDSLMYYRPDGSSEFVTIMYATASLSGRSGSIVLSGRGTFHHGTASMRLQTIEGAGTGDLGGLSATLDSNSTHADYPFMPITVDYEFT